MSICSAAGVSFPEAGPGRPLSTYLRPRSFSVAGAMRARPNVSLFSYCLNLLFSSHFSVPAAPTSGLIQLRFIYAAPTLPGTCQFDPCVVLQQRLAEAAEMGNIYRAVRWGRALLLLHSHPSRPSRLQHPQRHMGAAALVRTDAATIHAPPFTLHTPCVCKSRRMTQSLLVQAPDQLTSHMHLCPD